MTTSWCDAIAPYSWAPMPGQTWGAAAAAFLAMWIAMMVAMMLPSLVPMLGRYRRAVRGMDDVGTPRLAGLTAAVGLARAVGLG